MSQQYEYHTTGEEISDHLSYWLTCVTGGILCFWK